MARPHFLEPLLKKDAGPARLVIVRDGWETALATSVEGAFDSATRNRGLLGRDGLEAGRALAIAPTSAVHTFGMRFAIDVVFATREGKVVKIASSVPRGRIRVAIGAFAAIELAAGTTDKTGLAVGDTLAVRADAR